MADRSVSVRLSAKVDPYIRAMDQARAATSKLEKESSMNMSRLGSSMQNVGKKMTMGVTLPIVGIGAAAVKMSNDFDATFGQMVGLAGVAAEDVDGLKESVLDLAGTTARAPAELAEALYFAASAGLDTEQAMDAVNIAARAAAAGMGTTQDIVGLAASAVASYGAENINAAEATDILVSTIREGRAEPAELASTLGRVLPIAAQLGVTFDEVGGTVAVLSNVFGDTNRTVTATQGMFVKLLSPTKQGREALADMGTSVEELHAAVDQDGLLGALELLKAKGFDTNATALRALFDDIEGFQAASALLATDQETLASTFGATADAAGSLDTAFGALDEDSQAMKQAWVDMQIALIQVGEVVGPMVADLAGMVGGLAGAFSDLDPVLQKGIIGVAGLAAAAGPLLIITGSMIRNYATLKKAMESSNLTMGRLSGKSTLLKSSMVGIGVAVAAAAIIYENYNRKKQEAAERTAAFVDALEAEASGQDGAVDAMLARTLATDRTREAIDDLGLSAGAVARFIQGEEVPAIRELLDAYDRTGDSAEGFKIAQDDLGLSADANAADFAHLVTVIRDQAGAHGEAGEQITAEAATLGALSEGLYVHSSAARHAKKSTEDLADATTDGTQSQEEITAALEASEESAARVAAQADATAAAMDEWAEFTDELTAAHEAMIDEVLGSLSGMFDYEQAVLNLDNAYGSYQAAVKEAQEVLASSESTDREKAEALRGLRLEELALAEQTYETAAAYAEEQGALEGSSEWADIMRDKLEQQAAAYPELREEIDLLIGGLNRIPSNISTSVDITTYYRQVGSSTEPVQPGGGHRALGGPTSAGMMYEVNENGSELFTENGRTYLMSSTHGFVTPLPAGGSTPAAVDGGTRIGVNVERLIDQSGHSLEDVFRVANAHLMMGV